jgi:uncharacterized protein with PQ loop repeat
VDALDLLGYCAGFFTTIANLPQVITTYRRRSGEFLSFRMLASLGTGLALWALTASAHTRSRSSSSTQFRWRWS